MRAVAVDVLADAGGEIKSDFARITVHGVRFGRASWRWSRRHDVHASLAGRHKRGVIRRSQTVQKRPHKDPESVEVKANSTCEFRLTEVAKRAGASATFSELTQAIRKLLLCHLLVLIRVKVVAGLLPQKPTRQIALSPQALRVLGDAGIFRRVQAEVVAGRAVLELDRAVERFRDETRKREGQPHTTDPIQYTGLNARGEGVHEATYELSKISPVSSTPM